MDFESYSLTLEQDNNEISWVYNKDTNTSEGDDKGYLRNVEFIETVIPSDDTSETIDETSGSSNSSPGGSIYWQVLGLLGLIALRRSRHVNKKPSTRQVH